MRSIVWALLLVAGCYGESIHPRDYPREEPGPEGTEVSIDPKLIEVRTSELGTNLTRPIAKTIDWPGISTTEGTTFVSDAIVVDHIFRDDSDNSYGVRVRVKNTTAKGLKLEYLIRFYTRRGGRLEGYIGSEGSTERWTGFVVDPFSMEILTDFSRVIGAEGFRLYIRSGGSTAEDGGPDDPSKKEERKAQRAAEVKK
jgi:hypothetical protein